MTTEQKCKKCNTDNWGMWSVEACGYRSIQPTFNARISYTYELTQDHNTGNWWIWKVEECGYRSIVRTLSADLNVTEAHRYMDAYIEEKKNG